MLKLNASFSKKIPAGEEFSSQQYHASIEVELPDGLTGTQLQDRIHQTFDLVRTSVEAELRYNTPAAPQRQVVPPVPAQPAPTQPPQPSHNGKASGKQVAFLLDLAAHQGLNPAALNAKALDRFGCPTVQGLTRKQASDLIDLLSIQSRAAA